MRRIHRLLYGQQQCRTAAAGWGLTAALVTIAVALAAAWQTSAAPQQTPEQEAPYMEWVNEEVVYIIEPGEREAYLQLQSNNEREHFIEQFWLRRDPTPGTPGNEFKREHYRRIGYAMDRFRSAGMAGWKTDRGRVYVLYGPPDEIESHPAGRGGGPPFEQWLYNYIQGIGRRVIVEFVNVNRNGEYRQTRDPNTRN
jgi:GWxTD domain-containing protein